MSKVGSNAPDDFVSFSFRNILRTFVFWPRIFGLLWETHSVYLIAVLVANLLKGIVPALILISTKNLINSLVAGVSGGALNVVILAFVFLIALNLVSDVLNIVEGYFRSMFKNLLTNKINMSIIEKSQNLSLQSFEDGVVQNNLQRAQGEADYRPFEIFTQILAILSSFITLFSASIILVSWKWWVILIVLFIPFASFYSFLKIGQAEFNVHFKRASKQRESWYLSFLITRDNSFKEVKIFQLGNYLLKRYREILDGFYKEDKSLAQRRSWISFLFQLINQGANAIVIFLAVQAAFFGQILLGSLVGLIQAISLAQSTSHSIVQGILSLCQNNLYIKQLFDFLDLPEEIDESKPTSSLQAIEKIEFRNVSFTYPNTDKKAISNVSFTIHKGDKLAIVGRNGSGKSTIVKLLTQMYSDFEGEILINDRSIHSFDKEEYRKKIGVVFQDFVHYEMTVRDNIGFGNVDHKHDDQKIWAASTKAGTTPLISAMTDGLDTLLGKWFENGHQLSGGQWQRVAIARAFMREGELYILDEPSSFLDPYSEREVFETFGSLIHDRMAVFISHRLSSAKMAETIILMEQGEIAESGSHSYLMEKQGRYYDMYQTQASAYSHQEQWSLTSYV